jgi:hypothetical protein
MDEAMAETELVLELGEDRSAMAATTLKPFVFVLMPFSQEFNDGNPDTHKFVATRGISRWALRKPGKMGA